MGGNAFEDAEKLTNEEYIAIVAEITKALEPIVIKIEPYIPLPQKQFHGDADFLIILKEKYSLIDIQNILKIQKEKFIINKNLTANSVYKKKQIDFNVVKDEKEFELCQFYKSYSGVGAFLGLFLPSKFVKVCEKGIVCCVYHEHVKLEYVVCDRISEILKFYGLSFQIYQKGFQTRKQLFQFLRQLIFLNEQAFVKVNGKHQTKLMKFFQQYLKKCQLRQPKHKKIEQNQVLTFTLKYFKQEKQFQKQWQKTLSKEDRRKQLSKKFNGMHIMQIFKIENKFVNDLKKKFKQSFPDKIQYDEFILNTPFNEIVKSFAKICQLDQPTL